MFPWAFRRLFLVESSSSPGTAVRWSRGYGPREIQVKLHRLLSDVTALPGCQPHEETHGHVGKARPAW